MSGCGFICVEVCMQIKLGFQGLTARDICSGVNAVEQQSEWECMTCVNQSDRVPHRSNQPFLSAAHCGLQRDHRRWRLLRLLKAGKPMVKSDKAECNFQSIWQIVLRLFLCPMLEQIKKKLTMRTTASSFTACHLYRQQIAYSMWRITYSRSSLPPSPAKVRAELTQHNANITSPHTAMHS